MGVAIRFDCSVGKIYYWLSKFLQTMFHDTDTTIYVVK